MFRNTFVLFAAILMACAYVSNANPVKRQAGMGSSTTDSPSSGSGSSGQGSSGSGSSGSGSGSDSTTQSPSSGSNSGSSGSNSGSSGSNSGSSGSSDSGSGSGSKDSFFTGGLFQILARLLAGLPIAGGIVSPITNPIFINLGKFLG